MAILVKQRYNWADEITFTAFEVFDCDQASFMDQLQRFYLTAVVSNITDDMDVTITQTELRQHLKTPIEIGIGTNQVVDFSSFEDFRRVFFVSDISDDEYTFLKKTFQRYDSIGCGNSLIYMDDLVNFTITP